MPSNLPAQDRTAIGMILILLLFLFACAISLGLMQYVQDRAIASIEGTLGELKKRPQISEASELAPICPACGGRWGKWSAAVSMLGTTVLRHEQQRECTECGYAERKTVQ